MINPESSFGAPRARIPVETLPVLKGRDFVPVEEALAIQRNLIMMMVPQELSKYITGDVDDPILNAVTMRWMEKYVLEFNGFAEFCDIKAYDKAFMERVTQKTLTDKDYESMKAFLEESPEGGPLFADGELDKFIEDNIPS